MPVFQVKHKSRMTNADYQRAFREAHPDYYRLRMREKRARVKAYCEAIRTAQRAEAKRIADGVAAIVRSWSKTQLMLPAPVEMIELPIRSRAKVEIRREDAMG